MATAQGQDTGKAPENQGAEGGAPAADDFGDAFAELTAEEPAMMGATGPAAAAGGDGKAAGGAGAAGGETGPTGSEGGLPDPSTVDAGGGTAGTTGPAPTEEKPAAGATGPASQQGDGGAQFLKELERIMSAGGGQQPQQKQEPAPAVTPWSDEQSQQVARAREEYPEVFSAMDLEMKRLAQVVVDHVFQQYNPILQQLSGQVVNTANMTHEQQLYAAIPDYNDIAPKVRDWIGQQPAFLKSAYEQVAKQGSVQDVVDMVGQYRASTGTAALAPAPKPAAAVGADAAAAAAAAAKSATDAAAAAAAAARKRTAAALAPVGGRRSGTGGDVIDADDFAGAFEAFAHSA